MQQQLESIQAKLARHEDRLEEVRASIRDAKASNNVKALEQLQLENVELLGVIRELQAKENRLSSETAAAAGAAAAPAAADFLAAFKRKLAQCHINTPDEKAMQRVMIFFAARMQAAAQPSADPDIARFLYEEAVALLGTSTRAVIRDQQHISINGPWQPGVPYLVTAADLKSGELLVIKILARTSRSQLQAASAELQAVKLLQLDTLQPPECVLVPSHPVQISIRQDDALTLQMGKGDYDALRMPWFASSLAALPQLSQELIAAGGRRLQQALHTMHQAQLLHCDVKGSNVLVDSSGRWYLGDFGSSVPRGHKITSCTPNLHPGDMLNQPAEAHYDWGLLLVLIAVEVDKAGWQQQLLGSSQAATVQKDLVLKLLELQVKVPELQQLIDEVRDAAGW